MFKLRPLRPGNGPVPKYFPLELLPQTIQQRCTQQYQLDPDDASHASIINNVSAQTQAIVDQYSTTIEALDAIHALVPPGGEVPIAAVAEKLDLIDATYDKTLQRIETLTGALETQQKNAQAVVDATIKPSAEMAPFGQEIRAHYKAMGDTLAKGAELIAMARAGDPAIALIVTAPAVLSGINAETHATIKKIYSEAVAKKAFTQVLACQRITETLQRNGVSLLDKLEKATRIPLNQVRKYKADKQRADELKKKLGAMK